MAVWSSGIAMERCMSGYDSDDATPRERTTTDGEHYSSRSQFEIGLLEAQGRIKSLEDSRGFWKWVAGLGGPALFSALFILILHGQDRLSESAERVGEQRAEIRALQEQVRDLWLKLNKLAGLDQKGVTIVQAP